MKLKFYAFLLSCFFCCGLHAQTNAAFEKNALYLKFRGKSYSGISSLSSLPPAVQNIVEKYIVHFELTFAVLKAEQLNNTYTLTFADEDGTLKCLEALSSLPEVEYVERIPVYETSLIPNDPLLSQQWYIGSNYINAYTAWNLSTGSSSVKLAIVDNAVRITHQDLAPNVWTNPGEIAGNGIDDDNNGYIDDINGWDSGDNDNNPNPPGTATNSVYTHGTHCAGIADAKTNNALGIASIGFGVKLIGVKCNYDSNTGSSLNNTLGGVTYAIAARADVVSMSFGGGGNSQTFQNLFNYGHSLGITFVAAAGNSNTSQIHFPAGYNYVIAVAASDVGDVRAGFSNYGSWIDITAPGVNIFSSLAGTNSSYGNLSGTSMACPMVAGLCALIKSHSPSYTPDQIEQCLKAGADNINNANPNYIGQLGAGRINAYNALMCTPCLANASFSISPQELPNYPNGSNLTFNSTGAGTTLKWFLNNIYQSTGPTFNYTFNTIGPKTVTLVSLHPDSLCTDTLTKSFTVVDSIRNICRPMNGANWHFGSNCKVSFLTNPPSVFTGPMLTYEGSSAISDDCGNLLFYTEGSQVWDKSNILMPNGSGLLGNAFLTTTQAAAIIPKPGSSYLYYVFSQDWNGGNAGLRYSIVDLSRPGNGTTLNPLGDVTTKNALVISGVSEKLAVVRHANGTDYWVVTHNSNNQDFYAFLVTSNGISLTPVVSTINDGFSQNSTGGQIKFSPDGTRMAAALAINPNYNFKLYNFNKWTGVLSSDITFAIAPTNAFGYGLEFSPDGTKLYMATVEFSPKLVQYDFNTGLQTVLVNEVKFTGSRYGLGALQAAPDGKIYVAREYFPALGVIHNPNLAGLSCNYCEGTCGSLTGLNLAAGSFVYLGLPTFITPENPVPDFTFTDTCVNQLAKFYGTDFVSCGVENTYRWNFGDPASGNANTSVSRNPTHQFARAGLYSVSMILSNVCDTVTVTKQVSIICCSAPDNSNSGIRLCLGDTTQLSVAPANGIISWTPSAGLSSSVIANPFCYTSISRNYFVNINDTATGCSRIDTVSVLVHANQPVAITEAKNGCVRDTLRVIGSYGLVIWSNGVSGKTNIVANPGQYSVLAIDTNGCSARDTVEVTLGNLAVQISGTDSICSGSFATLFVRDSFDTYLWSNQETDSSIITSATGIYWLRVAKNGCYATDTFQVFLSTTAIGVSVSSTNSGCASTGSATAVASGGNGSFSYHWSNGATTSIISNISSGVYTVTVLSGSCTTNTSVTVGTSGGVTVNPSAVNTHCGQNNGTASVIPLTGSLPFSYIWSNSGTTQSISNVGAGTYSVTVTDAGGCSVTSSVIVNPSTVDPVSISGNKSIMCAGDSAHLCVDSTYISYEWNNALTSKCIYVYQAGNYYVTVTDNANCTVESNHLSISIFPSPPVSISVNGDTLIAYNAISYQWFYNNVAIPNAVSNVYIVTQPGDYSVEIEDSNGCRAVSNKILIATGIMNREKGEEMRVYPNPLESGRWSIDCSANWLGSDAEVFDNDGRLVYKSQIIGLKSDIELEVAKGIYLLKVSSEQRIIIRKLIKL